MTTFPEPPSDDYAVIYLEDTDKALPETLNPNTRYAYFKTIARGGKSIIQSCKDMHLGRTVCYKSLRSEFANDPVEQQRLLREARVSAMLQHPATVPTYELGRDNRGNLYFTMKLVHGYTLREVLDYRERYDLSQLVDVVVQVANALEYAHSHRVVHRDIKPENILVGPFGEVLLLDWGLAKVWHSDGSASDPLAPHTDPLGLSGRAETGITGQGALQGTVSYMSPEQIGRDPDINYRTDIFSLGVIFYEMLSGTLPAEADTVREVMEKVVEETPVPPSKRTRIQVPPLLDEIAMRCIQKNPDERIGSCAELIRLLRQDW